MFNIVKSNLHRDICRDPSLHAFVLNLYLNGEEFPEKVSNYFPLSDCKDDNLIRIMQNHLRDEKRHVLLYRKAISKLGQAVVDLDMKDIYNQIILDHTPPDVFAAPKDSSDHMAFKMANFMAHLHFLEKRIRCSLEYHVDACSLSPEPYIEKAVGKVLYDEKRHEDYTIKLVYDLLPKSLANKTLEIHRRSEQRANLDFSSKQLRRVLFHFSETLPSIHRSIYKTCSRLQAWSLRYV